MHIAEKTEHKQEYHYGTNVSFYIKLSRFRGVTIEGVALMTGFIDHLYTPFGSTGDYSAVASLYNSQITTAPAKLLSSLLCLHEPFPSNDF
jgi:hypothetical protein